MARWGGRWAGAWHGDWQGSVEEVTPVAAQLMATGVRKAKRYSANKRKQKPTRTQSE